jgi:hypothetical protein
MPKDASNPQVLFGILTILISYGPYTEKSVIAGFGAAAFVIRNLLAVIEQGQMQMQMQIL